MTVRIGQQIVEARRDALRMGRQIVEARGEML
jgi:hypothetical protein